MPTTAPASNNLRYMAFLARFAATAVDQLAMMIEASSPDLAQDRDVFQVIENEEKYIS